MRLYSVLMGGYVIMDMWVDAGGERSEIRGRGERLEGIIWVWSQ